MRENLYGGEMNTELTYFRSLWETRHLSPVSHSPEIWDERAQEWIDDLGRDGARRRGMRDRADATALYLRARGLLGAGDTVADVGCGPGLFVAEFARTAAHVTGFDYSKRFLEYAAEHAASRAIENVSFSQCDFLALDADAAGLTGAFDLVFTSITPAASGKGCLEKLMRMSRGYCYNASFVHARDSLAERVARDVFDFTYRPRWDGAGFYALANLLWLSGYYPETHYYNDVRDEFLVPTENLAAACARACGRASNEDVGRIYGYLRGLGGEIERHSAFRYGSILWDVRVRDAR